MIRVGIRPSRAGLLKAGMVNVIMMFLSIPLLIGNIVMLMFTEVDPKAIIYLICAVIQPNAALMAIITLG